MSVNHDANGDGSTDDPAWLVLAVRSADNAIRVQSKFVADGLFDRNIRILNDNWVGLRLEIANDISGELSSEASSFGYQARLWNTADSREGLRNWRNDDQYCSMRKVNLFLRKSRANKTPGQLIGRPLVADIGSRPCVGTNVGFARQS